VVDIILTPLQKLDDAVHEFLRETEQLPEGGFVTGWALGVARARVQSEEADMLPLAHGMTYAFGPQTSVVQLGGLAKYLDVVAEKAMWQDLSDPID